jgi:hypothetical protein
LTAETYGFTEKTPQGQNQQAQTTQEAAFEPSQEAHLAEVVCHRDLIHPFPGVCVCASARNGFYFPAVRGMADEKSF